jgi:BASS family bile acid:Na+ symporter
MPSYNDFVARACRFLSGWLLAMLIGVYVLAVFLPEGGWWAREATLGAFPLQSERTPVTLTMALLALMLFSAGLNIPLAQVRQLLREPAILVVGFFANMAVPVLYIFGVSLILRACSDLAAGQGVLLGLALVASMPIATSSAAWSQTSNGNLAVTLGLILGSTVLSPLTTPVVLHAANWLTGGALSDGLSVLAEAGLSMSLVVFVLLPSLLGVGLRWLLGDLRVGRVSPTLKLASCVILLFLNYTYASGSLPGIVAQPNWAFLMLAGSVALGMCVLTFAAGWALARLMRADAGQRTALMFGLGLNNNGAGLVLASLVLARLPEVMLIAFLYTLIQHVVAGVVQRFNQPISSIGGDNRSTGRRSPLRRTVARSRLPASATSSC